MDAEAIVTIHPSQFPDRVARDLADSLRQRQVNPKFHYDSFKQAQKWLALHQACSPSRTDADCAAIYDRAFADVVRQTTSVPTHVLGLGCGGGWKDARLLRQLQAAGHRAAYTPVDVSVPLVLEARQAALEVIPPERCFPYVCDLGSAADPMPALNERTGSSEPRLVTFFGMIPNFEPGLILPRLARLMGPEDTLLFSANLAPGPDYAAGVERILPLYANDLTRDWLLTFLLDLGVAADAGHMRFSIEDDAAFGLKRVTAYFNFGRPCRITLPSEAFVFMPDEQVRLFFSYRHTPGLIRQLLAAHRLRVAAEWIAASGEEGVFLVRAAGAGR